jgi:hypothetical protein
MKVKTLMIVLLLCQTVPVYAVGWVGKPVYQLQPDHYAADCYYFTLNGVAEADPVRLGSPWFAVNRATHPGAKDLYAALLAARLTGTAITVVTTGTLECGYAGVSYVVM